MNFVSTIHRFRFRYPRPIDVGYEIEKCFGIKMRPDAAGGAGRPRTAGDLLASVLRLVGQRKEVGGTSQRRSLLLLFRHVAGVLSGRCGVPRRRVRPSTPLADLMTRRRRRAMWAAVAERVRLPLPDLEPPRAWSKASDVLGNVALAAFLLLIASIFTWRFWYFLRAHLPWSVHRWLLNHGFVWHMGACCGIYLFIFFGLRYPWRLASAMLRRLETEFPSSLRTARDLTRLVDQEMSDAGLAKYLRPVVWNEGLAWVALRQIIADGMQLDRRQVTRDTLLSLDSGGPGRRPRCEVCGYDLRSSEGRCPECGVPIAESTPPDALLERLAPPAVTRDNLARFAVYRVRSAVVSYGSAVLAAGILLDSLDLVPLAWGVMFAGAVMLLWKVFSYWEWKDVPRWLPLSCPTCEGPFRTDRVGDYFHLTCLACGKRYRRKAA